MGSSAYSGLSEYNEAEIAVTAKNVITRFRMKEITYFALNFFSHAALKSPIQSESKGAPSTY